MSLHKRNTVYNTILQFMTNYVLIIRLTLSRRVTHYCVSDNLNSLKTSLCM